MLIAQISDLHIGIGERDRGNVARLAQVVERVAAIAPDLVVLSGDLAADGALASYRMLAPLLAPLAMPVLLAVGNHDARAALLDAFPTIPTHGGFVHYAYEDGALRVVVLDTLDEGRDGGGFCTTRAAWLDACLAEQPDRPTLIALHHPPAATGVAWMDVGADGPWSVRLGDVVRRHPQVVGLIAGHVHRAVATSFAGRPLFTAASCAPQVAYDPAPIDAERPDGRALIVAGAPGFAMHEWREGRLVSSFETAADAAIVARFDAAAQPMIAAAIGTTVSAGAAIPT